MARATLAAATVVGLLVAGCAASQGDSSSTAPAAFDDLQGEVTETTGLIRGVVVDPSIVPIPDAVVQVLGSTKHNLTSDKQGRFLLDGLEPGTYLLKAKSLLHHESQTTVDVQAGVKEPPITKIQLEPLFSQKPFSVPIKQNGYFECSQSGATPGLYSSSNCVVNYCKARLPPELCTSTQFMDNITSQNREWHMDVGPGWQQIVVEMTWTPTSDGTSQNLGMTLSWEKSRRAGTHMFASVNSGNPMRFQLDVGVDHETSQIPSATAPFPDNLTRIPAGGMERVSYFVSVRQDGLAPAIALNQKFEVVIHQFYYGFPKEGWSFVAGDKPPF